ncbi:sensor histidine kinase [Cohnella sp. AR92]|uniref:sensor histidine kinase n=1 Tax=Cohnella sp. AR92 TaxID=648716 RepID=UPI000F8C630E|nr:histidine kinase [Cohnella sp. AR92]RUS43322.1 hypothetical protein ELR57_25355 [Cohnella sp. AR92]
MSLAVIKDFLLQISFIAFPVFSIQLILIEKAEKERLIRLVLTVLFGLSLLICMSIPAYADSDFRLDIRAIPLLLGTLYGGRRTGLILAAAIALYRLSFGMDLGLLLTVIVLAVCMPAILYYQQAFARSERGRKLLIALSLASFYSLVGVLFNIILRGFSPPVFQVQLLHYVLSLVVLSLFISLNESISNMLRRNRQLQADAHAAEIALLRSQIKPHFLHNALNSIASLCIDEPQKAQDLTLEFSRYLRGSFNFQTLDTLTPLQHELDLVQAYVNIEKVRYGQRLRVEFDVNADPRLPIPPMILQPLVENAIRHGVTRNVQGGTVKVSIRQQADDSVSISVEDNGCGIAESKRLEIMESGSQKQGFGLWNINQRLKLLYGQSITIDSAVGIGTKVSFRTN